MGLWHRLLWIAVLCCAGPHVHGFALHGSDDREPAFRDVVHRLVRASRENLRPIKTFRINMHPSLEYWYEVEVMLPGAKTCRIYEHPRMVYRCEWKKPDNVAAKIVYAGVVQELKEALGQADWTVHASSHAAHLTRFEPVNPRRNPVWEVRLAGSKSTSPVEVLLFSVDRWNDTPQDADRK